MSQAVASLRAETLPLTSFVDEGRTLSLSKPLVLQVTVEDAASADRMFSILMGEDVEARREFIQQNAKEAFIDA